MKIDGNYSRCQREEYGWELKWGEGKHFRQEIVNEMGGNFLSDGETGVGLKEGQGNNVENRQ